MMMMMTTLTSWDEDSGNRCKGFSTDPSKHGFAQPALCLGESQWEVKVSTPRTDI